MSSKPLEEVAIQAHSVVTNTLHLWIQVMVDWKGEEMVETFWHASTK
jgi:hypothetical protein